MKGNERQQVRSLLCFSFDNQATIFFEPLRVTLYVYYDNLVYGDFELGTQIKCGGIVYPCILHDKVLDPPGPRGPNYGPRKNSPFFQIFQFFSQKAPLLQDGFRYESEILGIQWIFMPKGFDEKKFSKFENFFLSL